MKEVADKFEKLFKPDPARALTPVPNRAAPAPTPPRSARAGLSISRKTCYKCLSFISGNLTGTFRSKNRSEAGVGVRRLVSGVRCGAGAP